MLVLGQVGVLPADCVRGVAASVVGEDGIGGDGVRDFAQLGQLGKLARLAGG